MYFEIYNGARVPTEYASLMRRVKVNLKQRNALDSITLALAEDEEDIINNNRSNVNAAPDNFSFLYKDEDLQF